MAICSKVPLPPRSDISLARTRASSALLRQYSAVRNPALSWSAIRHLGAQWERLFRLPHRGRVICGPLHLYDVRPVTQCAPLFSSTEQRLLVPPVGRALGHFFANGSVLKALEGGLHTALLLLG